MFSFWLNRDESHPDGAGGELVLGGMDAAPRRRSRGSTSPARGTGRSPWTTSASTASPPAGAANAGARPSSTPARPPRGTHGRDREDQPRDWRQVHPRRGVPRHDRPVRRGTHRRPRRVHTDRSVHQRRPVRRRDGDVRTRIVASVSIESASARRSTRARRLLPARPGVSDDRFSSHVLSGCAAEAVRTRRWIRREDAGTERDARIDPDGDETRGDLGLSGESASDCDAVDRLPTVEFVLGGRSFALTPDQYVLRAGAGGGDDGAPAQEQCVSGTMGLDVPPRSA